MRLFERRYEAEDLGRSRWTVYFLDFQPLFATLDQMAVHASALFERWARNTPAKGNADQ